MIVILSQNKDDIMECNDVCAVKNKVYGMASTAETQTVIATYPTEERAKEVLAEIFGMIKNGFYSTKWIDNESYTNQPWYEMPQE